MSERRPIGPTKLVCPVCSEPEGALHDFEFCGLGAGTVQPLAEAQLARVREWAEGGHPTTGERGIGRHALAELLSLLARSATSPDGLSERVPRATAQVDPTESGGVLDWGSPLAESDTGRCTCHDPDASYREADAEYPYGRPDNPDAEDYRLARERCPIHGCTCGSTEPDEFGNRDQIENPDCPVHSPAPEPPLSPPTTDQGEGACPTCGEPVRVVTEGTTSHYESVALAALTALSEWAGANKKRIPEDASPELAEWVKGFEFCRKAVEQRIEAAIKEATG